MKRKKITRVAAVMFALTLVSTSIIGGTFAKYTTTGNASETARVAKFGVTVSASGNLFADTYIKDANTPGNSNDTTQTLTVKSNANDNVVAPGTKNSGNGLNLSISGTPEVDTELTATITAQDIFLDAGTYGVMVNAGAVTAQSFKANTNTYYTLSDEKYTLANSYSTTDSYYVLTNKVTLDNAYYPVEFTLGEEAAAASEEGEADADDENTTATDKSLNTIAASIAKKLNGTVVDAEYDKDNATIKTYSVTNKTYSAGDNLSEKINLKNVNLSWEWKYTNGDNNDKADTILGDLGVDGVKVVKLDSDNSTYSAPTENSDYCLNTQFAIDITVTQVD
jgi:hypothetical protein